MKLYELKLKNLNSFREEITLDFENGSLAGASLVAITGPTGSGKTTLFDAICVALYGKTPRLPGDGEAKALLSLGETEGSAEVIFEANGIRYRAKWSVKHGDSPSGLLTNVDTGAVITERLSHRGKRVGASENTVSEEIESVLGLDFDAFRRSVMLAQGDFTAFLKAGNKKRLEILETVADTGIYNDLAETLREKVQSVKDAYNEVQEKVHNIPKPSDQEIAEAEEKLSQLQKKTNSLAAKKGQWERIKKAEIGRRTSFGELQSTATAVGEAETTRDAEQKQCNQQQDKLDALNADYRKAVPEHQNKRDAHIAARSDVRQAQNRFTHADGLIPNLQKLDEQIEALSDQLAEDGTRQTELDRQIQDAQKFLDENALPLDRQQRLTRANVLLAKHRSQRSQVEERLASQNGQADRVASFQRGLAQLSQHHKNLLVEKTAADAALAKARKTLEMLQERGDLVYWRFRRTQAQRALPIAQRYENASSELGDEERKVEQLEKDLASVDKSLAGVGQELVVQTQVCKRADAEVSRLEAERELAVLADPINELRHRLEPGEPCLVCGAIEHPSADEVEIETADRLETLDNALGIARTTAREALENRNSLLQSQSRLEQNQTNFTEQIDARLSEIKRLNGETEAAQAQWQEIYPDTEISSEWASQQNQDAETAMDALRKAEASHEQATYDCEIAKQQLANCEQNIADKQVQLANAEGELQTVIDALEDLKADIAATETCFWETMPDAFHGLTLEEAVSQFEKRIEEVEAREDELQKKRNQLSVLASEIRANRDSLESAKEQRKSAHASIEGCQREGGALLEAASEKTGGLTTEEEIDAAIESLDAELQELGSQRDKAEQLLQRSKTLLTQAQTIYDQSVPSLKEHAVNLETAHVTYLEKSRDAGFDAPGSHDNAFRTWMQEVRDAIDAYTQETRELEVDIANLLQVEETPFDSLESERIASELAKIDDGAREVERNIGAQELRIAALKDARSAHKAHEDEIQKAKREMERWSSLQDVFLYNSKRASTNDLRSFAAEIMLQQVSQFANAQLEYLTSGRYQLKVESIGKLAVVDKWNVNEERPVETLSGGESFLTSLALALALSELSRGRAEIGALFLDEGFGTLDAETLDVAISALEGLRLQGRSIFLISHIQELTRRLPVKINVRKRGNGSSTVRVQG